MAQSMWQKYFIEMCPMCNIKLHSDCAVYMEISVSYIKQTPAQINKDKTTRQRRQQQKKKEKEEEELNHETTMAAKNEPTAKEVARKQMPCLDLSTGNPEQKQQNSTKKEEKTTHPLRHHKIAPRKKMKWNKITKNHP